MKRLFVVTLLVMVMSACTRTQVSAPEEQPGQFLFQLPITTSFETWEAQTIPAGTMEPEKSVTVKKVNTDGSLTKGSQQCSNTYLPTGPTSRRFSFESFSGFWPPSAPNVVIWYFGGIYPNDSRVHDFIPGVAVLDGDLDCWTTLPAFKITITLRKRGADAANVSPVLRVFSVDNNKLRFVFAPGDINLRGRHADVNIDIANVTLSAP